MFKANLGSAIVQTYKFINYVQKPTQYSIKIENLGKQPVASGKNKAAVGNFSVDSTSVNAPAADSKEGIEVPINIKFEPSSLNESRGLMTITSNEGGEYQCYLIGTTLTPQPKGPFKVIITNFNIFRLLEKEQVLSSKILSMRQQSLN